MRFVTMVIGSLVAGMIAIPATQRTIDWQSCGDEAQCAKPGLVIVNS